MKRFDAFKGLLVLLAVLLAANALIALQGRQDPAPSLNLAAAQTPTILTSPARPQWIVTTDSTGKCIYIWKYNGSDYEVARYEYQP